MSQFSNPEYEAMTPTEKIEWHREEARKSRKWYRDPNGYWICTKVSQIDANRHERCARILKECYRLPA